MGAVLLHWSAAWSVAGSGIVRSASTGPGLTHERLRRVDAVLCRGVLETQPESQPPGRARVDWSDWNRALAVVNMIAPTAVAVQAVEIDAAM